jgi:hypothetical protein
LPRLQRLAGRSGRRLGRSSTGHGQGQGERQDPRRCRAPSPPASHPAAILADTRPARASPARTAAIQGWPWAEMLLASCLTQSRVHG